VEELKRRLMQQEQLLQQQDEAINSAIRPGPRGSDPQLRDEIGNLRKELLQSQRFTNEIIIIVRETLINTLGSSVPSNLGFGKGELLRYWWN
jgi:hypothetical protein